MLIKLSLRALLASLLLSGCSTGDPVAPKPDFKRRLDRDVVDQELIPDQEVMRDRARPADYPRLPDSKVPKPDTGLCGNKVVDPGEACDKAITAGNPGACPQSATDCDDKNKCTTDTYSGSVVSCTASCDHAAISNCCGNGTIEGAEACDDGNVTDSDGCSNSCQLPGGHLLITEIALSPSEAEFVEIYNPTTAAIPLDNVYLADRIDYYQLPKGMSSASTDFIARFPAGSSIGPGAYLVVAIRGSLQYKTSYGKAPDLELINTEAGVPDMLPAFPGSISTTAGLTDGGEILMLFRWDGSSDLVQDLDYARWQQTSSSAVWKTPTLCIDGPDADTTPTCYKNDTDLTVQPYMKPSGSGGSLHRCNYLEGTETKTGGNGATGHDETSEPVDGAGATWKVNSTNPKLRTPGLPAPPAFCPQV